MPGLARLVEHAPRDVRIADPVEGVRRQEREGIAGLHAGQVASDPGSDRVAFVHALVEGLRLGLCAAEPTLSPDRAARLVAAATTPSSQLA